jgi:predicted heme/steroid binding protein
MMPNPENMISGGKKELPEVEQLGTISLETLQTFHCTNPDRRCFSLFGTVYDVTSSLTSYGPDGAYKEFAGHDITLAMATHKTGEDWLDKFCFFTEKWTADAQKWGSYFATKYPICGKLDVWENSDPATWDPLSDREQEELAKSCAIM